VVPVGRRRLLPAPLLALCCTVVACGGADVTVTPGDGRTVTTLAASGGPERDAVRDATFDALDTLRQTGEKIFPENPTISDTELRDQVLANAGRVGDTLVADGDAGIAVSVAGNGFSCSGVLVFSSGAATWNGVNCS